ncbi:electron transport complex subunit RsxC [Alkalibacterium pelagium]|jgi:electron transport complex protein RnfC|uniref:Ion-translocating oxidoreductase complex subunit C n=1 Tax=Alkalibacterium pelagium TaxID=426702 RepID=A0A1H7EZM8_9LACT|nr:electron transport complex subunit RsxC [Alkalibacterium pelagium]GEN49540.1 electron transport complex subunit C [Alkalibacterium pelagium]SEK19299.1 electron transport complex protein RnfC [Alkalibacterium pelagium]
MRFKTVQKATYPKHNKSRTHHKPIEKIDAPAIMVFPMSMHLGAPAKPVVAVGDKVKVGTLLGEAQGFISANVLSSVSGEVISIEERDVLSDVYTCVIIKNDGEYTEEPPFPEAGDNVDPALVPELIKRAGISGMGGATFPTNVKMSPPKDKKIDTLILNGAECEPYSTSDLRTMIEYADEIIEGVRVIDSVFNVDKVFIGIEDNAKEAGEALRKAAEGYDKVEIKVLEAKYPQGSEKQLIENCTGRQVPAGGLPADIGCVVSNVGTFQMIYRAVRLGKPMVERVCTISGTPIADPKNLLVRLGTPIDDVIDFCGGFQEAPRKVIHGGPMMGKTIKDGAIPISKGTTHVTFLTAEEVEDEERMDCIRCSECINVCPVSLQPILISNAYERGDIEKAEQLGAMDCIECGNCSYICPSKIPLLDNIRKAKTAIRQNVKAV